MTQGVNEDKLQDEISVALMADLQEKQVTESTAMTNVLTDKVRNFKNGQCVVMFMSVGICGHLIVDYELCQFVHVGRVAWKDVEPVLELLQNFHVLLDFHMLTNFTCFAKFACLTIFLCKAHLPTDRSLL